MFEEIEIRFIGGAGYMIRHGGRTIGLDLYLTDSCRRNGTDSFKRLVPCPVRPENLRLDAILASHEHGDHFDIGSVPQLMENNPAAMLFGPISVLETADQIGVDLRRTRCVQRGESLSVCDTTVTATYCDHGEDSPHAVGFLIDVSGKRLFFVGDCRYSDTWSEEVGDIGKVDFMMVPINGAYGNPDAVQAAKMVAAIDPLIAVPCHYWLFREHGGDPAQFEKACDELGILPSVRFLAVGESFFL